jgi:hypothetical protein
MTNYKRIQLCSIIIAMILVIIYLSVYWQIPLSALLPLSLHKPIELFKTGEIDDNTINADILYDSLAYISNILYENNIKHWVMYGTLLGAIRNNDIIPYDYDIDFGANINDVDKIIELNKYIMKDGYSFSKPYSYIDDNKIWRVSLKISYNNIVVGDIYLYDNFSDGFSRRFDIKTGTYFWPKATFPTWYINTLTNVKIRDKIFPSPRNPEILLLHWYGDNWKVPIKAKAQGGEGDAGSDYYGGAIDLKLSFLMNKLPSNNKVYPNINHKIIYVYPPSHIEWVMQNENYHK